VRLLLIVLPERQCSLTEHVCKGRLAIHQEASHQAQLQAHMVQEQHILGLAMAHHLALEQQRLMTWLIALLVRQNNQMAAVCKVGRHHTHQEQQVRQAHMVDTHQAVVIQRTAIYRLENNRNRDLRKETPSLFGGFFLSNGLAHMSCSRMVSTA